MRYAPQAATSTACRPGEGASCACTFWFADNHALAGGRDEAPEVFERLLGLRNDVGLLTEEYDTGRRPAGRQQPQAFSHVPLVNTAYTLQAAGRGASRRRAAVPPGERAVTGPGRTAEQRRAVLPVTLVRAAAGALMLARPDTVADAYGSPPTPVAQAVVRVLGGRHAVQAALTYAFPGPPVPALGALVDVTHALTAVAWAATAPSRRRPGPPARRWPCCSPPGAGRRTAWGVGPGGSLRPPPSTRERDAP